MIYNNLENLRIFAYFETNVELLKNKATFWALFCHLCLQIRLIFIYFSAQMVSEVN